MLKRLAVLSCLVVAVAVGVSQASEKLVLNVPQSLQVSKLFVTLPEDIVATPDGMAIHPNGDLVVACPNFGNQSLPGTIIRITPDGRISKWFDVPVNKKSGVARPMGIDFDADGNLYIVDNQGWTGNPESVDQGRILKIEFDRAGTPRRTTEIAVGMEHPNGVKIRDGYAYVTQSSLSRVQTPSGKLLSCVYRFPIDARNIQITNTPADRHMITTFITENLNIQYGADGLVFDPAGNLYVGNFGDGAVHKITFNPDGSVRDNYVWAQDNANLVTTDGMCMDRDGNIYIADFNVNAIAKVDKDAAVTRIAMSPDSDGAQGQLDQPGEPIVWNGRLYVTCFDMVTDDGKVNVRHDAPHTIVMLDLP